MVSVYTVVLCLSHGVERKAHDHRRRRSRSKEEIGPEWKYAPLLSLG